MDNNPTDQISLKSDHFEAHGQSIMFYEKEKNGDNFLLKFIKDENLLIALVADGISNQPCDWLASCMTCEKFLEFFTRNMSLPVVERIRGAINFCYDSLLTVSDECTGLAATLSLAVFDFNTETFHFVNMGDSKIYKITGGEIFQLTRDDSVVTKTIRSLSGIKDVKTITNYLGKEHPDIIINHGNIRINDIILLATDGFYDARKSLFGKNMVELSCSVNLKAEFDKIIKKNQIIPNDDMTAIVIKQK